MTGVLPTRPEDMPLEVSKPSMTVEADLYRITWPWGITATVERLSEHREELTGEVTIQSKRSLNGPLRHSGRLDLMSTPARRTLIAALASRGKETDWAAIVDDLCTLVRNHYRNGSPSIDLREHAPFPGPRWLLEPFVERSDGTVVFADGGTGKSIVGLAIAASIASRQPIIGRLHGPARPTLYLDWETNADTAHERLNAICTGAGLESPPPVFYRRQVASLDESASVIRREVQRLGVGFTVIDSLGMARGGEPESAEVTIRLFNAARSLGVPWLGIDHVTKAQGNNGSRPFGSIYTHNAARLTWGMNKEQEKGANAVVVSLKNYKRNNGRLLPTIGYRIEFEGDDHLLRAVRFSHTDLANVPALAETMSVRQRILAGLRGGPVEDKVIVETLGVKPAQVRARMHEMVKSGELVRSPDGRLALPLGPN